MKSKARAPLGFRKFDEPLNYNKRFTPLDSIC